MLIRIWALIAVAGLAMAPSRSQTSQDLASRERHLRNIRQLTFGGENAEAYFSADGSRLIFQSTRDGRA